MTTHLPAFLTRPGSVRAHFLAEFEDDGLGHVQAGACSTWWVAEQPEFAGWGHQGYYAHSAATCTGPHPSRAEDLQALALAGAA
jgi:hypothetical protein